MRLAAGALAAGLVLLIAGAVAARFWLGGHLDDYRPRIEAALSSQVAVRARIGHLAVVWDGLLPEFILQDVTFQGAGGDVDLSLQRISARLALLPLLIGRLDFSRLEIDHPVVTVERRADGRLVVAGILLPTPTEEPGSPFVDWLLTQREVRISDGRLLWQDQRAGGRTLELPALQFRCRSDGAHHQFDLHADAPHTLMRGLALGGDFTAGDSRHVEAWHGKASWHTDFIDIGKLRDYFLAPADWRSGRGAITVELDFGMAQVQALRADARLQDVEVKLAPELAPLRFDQLSGRISYASQPGGFRLGARQFLAQAPAGATTTPQTRPSDFDLSVGAHGGTAQADIINLGALAALTESLPIPADLRGVLRDRAPQGVIQGLHAQWQTKGSSIEQASVSARLTDISLRPSGHQPGVRHLSATIDADGRGGHLDLDSQGFELLVPDLFEQPLALRSVQATARWTGQSGGIGVHVERLRVDDPDVAASIAGDIAIDAEGRPRETHLGAQLERAELSAVSRFLPTVIARDARQWVATALRAGQLRDASVVLAGDLQDFPFGRPKRGQFHAHGVIDGARVDFAPGWPGLTAIRGTLDFEGPRLSIHASEGHVDRLVARDADAVIPDLESRDPVVEVKGRAGGPAQSALEFILQSPLRKPLGAFASSFNASGDVAVELSLQVPLQHADDFKVQGDVIVEAAGLVDPAGDIPPLAIEHSRLHFTEDAVSAERLTARVLGGAAEGSVHSSPDGNVELLAHGQVDGDDVARTYGKGRLGFLHGTGDWSGRFRFGAHGQAIEVKGHLPVFGKAASFDLRQGDGPLTLHAEGDPPLEAALREFAPGLITAGEGQVAWILDLQHDKGGDAINGSARFRLFGEPADARFTGHGDAITAEIRGAARAEALLAFAPGCPAGILQGSTPWELHVDERPGQPLWKLDADLRGLRIGLPPPFGKPASEPWPLHVQAIRLRGASDLYIAGGIDALGGLAMLLPDGATDPVRRVALRIGGPAVLPSTDGLSLTGSIPLVDLAAWRRAFRNPTAASGAAPAVATAEGFAIPPDLPASLDFTIGQMIAGHYRFDAHHWTAHRNATGWTAQVRGPQIEGDLALGAKGDRVQVRLEHLYVAGSADAADVRGAATVESTPDDPARTLPTLDVMVREFRLDGRSLGQLELRGEPEPGGWHIAHLGLRVPHGTLTGQGHWTHKPGQARTELTATLDSDDSGALLVDLGYPKALSRGKSQLKAAIAWPGDLEQFDPARLSGSLDLDSRSGQFLTVEPGAGRLLGLLSLQALPRRVTLDFRDIFSQGFAFDSITGHFDILQGTMTTQKLEMLGPAAQVLLRGQVSLGEETEDLFVRVRPAVGNGVALASTLALGPAVGATAWLLQKLLQNPIDKILAFEYQVTGSWDDPQVTRVDRSRAAVPDAAPSDRPGQH